MRQHNILELIDQIVEFLAEINPAIAYVSIPTRPPALNWAEPPAEDPLNEAYQIVKQHIDSVEYLIGYEGNAFGFTGNIEEDLLSITAVHPLRADAVDELLARDGAQTVSPFKISPPAATSY